MNPIACIACGNAEMKDVRPYRTNTPYGRRVFGKPSLFECGGCGLVQVYPQPDTTTLTQYYMEDYRKFLQYGQQVSDPQAFPRDNLFYFNRGESIAELLRPHVTTPNPEMLDVGAGYGHILNSLKQRFPQARKNAIEYSEVCVNFLKKTGVSVASLPMEEVLAGCAEQYDLVILSHVLEHLQDPGKSLALIRRCLKPGGIFYAEVPNIPRESLLKYPDHHWAPRYDEPHITFFSKLTLERLVARAGFQKLFCDTGGPEYTYVSRLRFHLPPLRKTVTEMLPKPVFQFLRRLPATRAVRVHEREESFYQYSGLRIWIRSVWRREP